MTASYFGMGILLACLSGVCLLAFGISLILSVHTGKKPRYLRKMPRKAYPAECLGALTLAYDATGSIRGMLLLLEEKWTSGPPRKRIMAALDYLDHSRYRDYETALNYLSDQTSQCEAILKEILEKEIRKQRGLVCKQETRKETP